MLQQNYLVAIVTAAICIGTSRCLSPFSLTRHQHNNNIQSWTNACCANNIPRCSTVLALNPKNDDEGESNELLFVERKSTVDFQNNRFLGRRCMVTGSMSAAIFMAATTTTRSGSPLVVANAATPSKNAIPTWTLQKGVKMPVLALNTVGLSVEDTERAVGFALQEGITHVDFHPGKERDGVAQYMANNPGSRKNLFLNTKIRKAPPGTSPEEAANRARTQIEEDLKALNVRNVDMLMLRDSPDRAVIQAQWAVLEEAFRTGKTRSVGVINFCQSALECVLENAKVQPALNYHMLHIGMGADAHGLRTFGESKGIPTFAYGAVGEPGPEKKIMNNPVLRRIGKAHDLPTTPSLEEQVALRWVLQTGAAVSVRPTTDFGLGTSLCSNENPNCQVGLAARAASFDWTLSAEEMNELNSLTKPDANPTLFSSSGCPGAFVMPPKK